MRVFIVVLVLIFSLQLWVKADDIRDFEIEGISIGDSLLDFFTKNELNNAYEIYDYKNKKYRYYFLNYRKSQTYEYLQITVKPSDKKFLIQGIDGHISYENNINDCYKKMRSVKKEIEGVITAIGLNDSGAHPGYPGSKYKRVFYKIDNGVAELACYDMSKKSKKADRFGVSIKNIKFLNFLTNEAY